MSEITTTRLKDIFRFPFHGPDWQKRFLIGIGLMLANFLVPILPSLFVVGYTLRVMRQAAEGKEPALPEWDDWGQLALDGLQVMLVRIAYLLPGMLILFAGMGAYFMGSMILPLLMATMEEGGQFMVVFPLLLFFLMGVMFLSMAAGWLLMILGAVPLPTVIAHFAVKKEFGAAFQIREWWPILRRNWMGYFVAWVVMAGLFTVIYIAIILAYYTMVLCFLVPLIALPAGFYMLLVGAAIFGQTYGEGREMVAAVGGEISATV